MQIPVLDPILFTVDPYTVELRDIRRPEMQAAALDSYVLGQMLEQWSDLENPPEGFAAGLFLQGTLIGSGIFYDIDLVSPDPLEAEGRVLLATPNNPEVAAALMEGIEGYQGSSDGTPITFHLKA